MCPDCQASSDWTADLDRCRQCGSVRLVRRLGEVECRDCGFVVPPDGSFGGSLVPPDGSFGGSVPIAGGQAPGLAEEVALALERVLGRANGKPPASAAVP